MKRILLATVLLLTIWARSVHAQETAPAEQGAPTLTSASVSLWPEYDRPQMLVILRGEFSADAPLPVTVELRIPANVGQPSAVAYIDEEGQPLNQQYATRADGDWLVVSFSAPTLQFQLEYYAPLVQEGDRRAFAYTYPADYAVTALHLDAQVPPTAQDFALDPAADSVTQEADGLTYHLAEAGPLAQGQNRNWTVSYRKADAVLTVDAASPTSVPNLQPTGKDQGGPNTTVLIFLVAFLALVGVGAGAFWLGRRVQPAAASEDAGGRGATPGARRGTGRRWSGESPVDDSLFCHVCGARLRPDAAFCHKCATPVRGRKA